MARARLKLRTLVLAGALAAPGGCAVDSIDPEDPEASEIAQAISEPITGLVLVTGTSESSSSWWRSPEAYCPDNRMLIGMGASQPASGSILFRGVNPYTQDHAYPDSAEAGAQEDLAGTTASWSNSAYAICGVMPAGWSIVQSGSSYSSSASRTWSVSCPSGKKVIGAGGTIWEGEGRVKIDEIRPSDTLDYVTVVASEDQDGTGESWSLRAYAICAYPPPGLVRVKAVTASGWHGETTNARCPEGKILLGLGGGVAASDLRPMRIYNMMPSGSLSTATVRVTTKGSTTGVSGEARSYAICADAP